MQQRTNRQPQRPRPADKIIKERKALRAEEGRVAWAEHLSKQHAIDENMARLRAERLKRECEALKEKGPIRGLSL
jgi:hypothetical protein